MGVGTRESEFESSPSGARTRRAMCNAARIFRQAAANAAGTDVPKAPRAKSDPRASPPASGVLLPPVLPAFRVNPVSLPHWSGGPILITTRPRWSPLRYSLPSPPHPSLPPPLLKSPHIKGQTGSSPPASPRTDPVSPLHFPPVGNISHHETPYRQLMLPCTGLIRASVGYLLSRMSSVYPHNLRRRSTPAHPDLGAFLRWCLTHIQDAVQREDYDLAYAWQVVDHAARWYARPVDSIDLHQYWRRERGVTDPHPALWLSNTDTLTHWKD